MKKVALILTTCTLLSACAPTLEEGITAYKSHRYDKALEAFSKHADDPVAQLYLSKMYFNANGVAEDKKKGLGLLKQAAEKGSAEALQRLGDKYISGDDGLTKDDGEALRLYAEAAAKGRKSAFLDLGRLTSDKKKAFEYYLQAAGTALGDWNLANLYETGDHDGIASDPKLSYDYMQAVSQAKGDEAKSYNEENFKLSLAEYYYYGFGTQKNDIEALKILASLKDKNEDAKAFFAWMLFWGEGVRADPAEAVRIWLPILEKKQKEEGNSYLNAYAFYGLVIAFSDGRGTTANPSQAALFLKRSKIKASSNLADWFHVKYNALGYLDKECRDSAFLGIRDGEYGRYKPVYADALIAVSKCMSKSTPYERENAYKMVQKASKLGNAEALRPAEEQWDKMSQKEQKAYSVNEANYTKYGQILQELFEPKKDGVRIGMTKAETINSSWGRPKNINTTMNANGTKEQWIYEGHNYLYFEGNILVSIKTAQ